MCVLFVLILFVYTINPLFYRRFGDTRTDLISYLLNCRHNALNRNGRQETENQQLIELHQLTASVSPSFFIQPLILVRQPGSVSQAHRAKQSERK